MAVALSIFTRDMKRNPSEVGHPLVQQVRVRAIRLWEFLYKLRSCFWGPYMRGSHYSAPDLQKLPYTDTQTPAMVLAVNWNLLARRVDPPAAVNMDRA